MTYIKPAFRHPSAQPNAIGYYKKAFLPCVQDVVMIVSTVLLYRLVLNWPLSHIA
nr:hypothetical protein [Candidatus Brachybacter algidus]